jgi:hypothetical protein
VGFHCALLLVVEMVSVKSIGSLDWVSLYERRVLVNGSVCVPLSLEREVPLSSVHMILLLICAADGRVL